MTSHMIWPTDYLPFYKCHVALVSKTHLREGSSQEEATEEEARQGLSGFNPDWVVPCTELPHPLRQASYGQETAFGEPLRTDQEH